jgi:hypothetical protein
MCWFSEGAAFPNQAVAFPNPAVCVGSLERSATAVIDGPWADVESAEQNVVGLVTDRVRAVMLVDGARRVHRVPLSEGFYVSPLPTGNERLVAITRRGVEPLYPQPSPPPPRILGSATKIIARSSRLAVVITGSRGLHVQLMSEMSCMTPQAAAGVPTGPGDIVKGYQHQAPYQVPAAVPLGFPAGSSSLPTCYVSAMVLAGARTRGTARVTIADR